MGKWLNKFLTERPQNRSDKSDSWNSKSHLSVLSPSPQDTFEKNLGNMSRALSDKSDSWNLTSTSSLYNDYEERLAIAEVDGSQNPTQAQRIAYLDAFISILSGLAEDDPQKVWLTQKIQIALAILEAQRFPMMN